MTVLQEAAQTLAEDEMRSLQSPSFRNQVARWRSGSEGRRVSAAFARFLNSLNMIRPGWLNARTTEGHHAEPPMANPLPIGPQKAEESVSPKVTVAWMMRNCWSSGWWFLTWALRNKWSVIMALLCLAFPRLLAIICAGVLRLCFRAVMAIIARVFQEVWAELRVGLGHMSLATSVLEETLLYHLQEFFSDTPTSIPQIPFANPTPTPMTDSGAVGNHGGGSPPPNPPWGFLSTLLLVFNLVLQRRGHLPWTGGVG